MSGSSKTVEEALGVEPYLSEFDELMIIEDDIIAMVTREFL